MNIPGPDSLEVIRVTGTGGKTIKVGVGETGTGVPIARDVDPEFVFLFAAAPDQHHAILRHLDTLKQLQGKINFEYLTEDEVGRFNESVKALEVAIIQAQLSEAGE